MSEQDLLADCRKDTRMSDLTRAHIVKELFSFAAAFHDPADPESTGQAMSNVFQQGAQLIEEEGAAAAALEQAQSEIATHQAQYENIAGYVKDRQERIEQLEAGLRREKLAEGREHLTVTNEFQSDKYPWCPAGFVPLKVTDPMATTLLWAYAGRRRVVDKDFARDLEEALLFAGDTPPVPQSKSQERRYADESQRPRSGSVGDETDCQYCASDFDSPICGDQEFLRDERIACTRPPGHAGWHVACGVHHHIAEWPNEQTEIVEGTGS